MDEQEQAAMQKLLEAADAILALGLKVNHHEFFLHVHGLQGFIVQHMLHRLEPEHWAAWYEEGEGS